MHYLRQGGRKEGVIVIYFDNAATTKYKPQGVMDAFTYYVTEIGVSPGRGSYSLGIEASRMLYKSRMTVAKYFGLTEPNVIFTKNSTEAINLFFRGYLKRGDHVVISAYEHNAVLRPLEAMRQEGVIEYSVIARKDLEGSPDYIIKKYFKSNTRLIVLTLASNLTGRVIFNKELFQAASEFGVEGFVDASQGAGKIRLDMINDCIEYLAFTGHKDLKGLPGVGGLCSRQEFLFNPLIQGGTGVFGHEKVNPSVYPEGYEAGTLNMPAIWALKNAIDYTIEKFDYDKVYETKLTNYLIGRLKEIDSIDIYDLEHNRISTIGFNIKGYSSNEIVQMLDKKDICTRGGIHCAILTHEALNTTDKGVVRVSLCEKNTVEEIDVLIETLKEIGEEGCL